MDLALTHPTDGYYSGMQWLLGPRGHFSTAPRLSQAFNEAVGKLLEELIDASLDACGAPPGAADRPGVDGSPAAVALLELGAGEADLAQALLQRWETTRPDLRGPLTYTILEVGEHLRAQQQRILAKAMGSGWKIRWAETVGEALAGAAATVMVGNEFIDALPVHLVDVRGAEPVEAWVETQPGGSGTGAGASVGAAVGMAVREVWDALSPEANTELLAVFGTTEVGALRPLTRDGIIELRPAAGSFLRQSATRAPAVCLLTIDYGEWFAGPDADSGCAADAAAEEGEAAPGLGRVADAVQRPLCGRTLRGYFRHQLVSDPYVRVGRQDLTADVDFRALDVHGRQAGFETVLFASVADLLRANGGDERLEALRREAARPSQAALDADQQAAVLEGLLDSRGLGGAFKVMLQVKE
jgi:SAM-dependent MidA family methyltransferase